MTESIDSWIAEHRTHQTLFDADWQYQALSRQATSPARGDSIVTRHRWYRAAVVARAAAEIEKNRRLAETDLEVIEILRVDVDPGTEPASHVVANDAKQQDPAKARSEIVEQRLCDLIS